LLIEAVPSTKRIAALVDVIRTSRLHVGKLQDAAAARGVEVAVFDAGTHDDVIPAIDAAKKSGVGALNFLASPLFTINAVSFLEHLARQRLPAVHQWPELAEEGGLIGYGPRYTDVFRLRARLVARVLRGGRPADIPVEQPTRFELVINLQTAKAIGYELPAGLVLRADKVIE
jgi:ABC-type uncharacterized transport system substrate-binding protein